MTNQTMRIREFYCHICGLCEHRCECKDKKERIKEATRLPDD